MRYRHVYCERQLVGTFGAETVSVPRARAIDETGKINEWRSKALLRFQLLTQKAAALIASVYLARTNTRRVKWVLYGLFGGGGEQGCGQPSRRKVKVAWEAWATRNLTDEAIARLILGGTMIKTRIGMKATNNSVVAAIDVCLDEQKVLPFIKSMGGESRVAWGQFLRYLDARGLKRPEIVIVDAASNAARFPSIAICLAKPRNVCRTNSPRIAAT